MVSLCRIVLFLTLIIAFPPMVATAENTPSKTILVFGDSLTAGYGIALKDAFPAQLERKLKQAGYPVSVINAGVSGDTTSGGLTRLAWTLKKNPDYVILELGANDMLRAIDPKITQGNLQKMLEILKGKKIPVLLAGMKATPNLGQEFVTSYEKMYRQLARKYGAVYYPFFLEGVATHKDLLQDDGLHPNIAGNAVIAQKILPSVEKMLGKK